MTEKTLYHSFLGLRDRKLANVAIDQARFQAYIPEDLEIVAFSKQHEPKGQSEFSRVIMDYLLLFSETTLPDLNEWVVFRKNAREITE